MFPFVYGFKWDAGNIIFLGLFFCAVGVLVSTVVVAVLRARRDFKLQLQDTIRWKSDFHDLPAVARKCRHEYTGEFKQRTCDKAFDCRECATHAKLVEHAAEISPVSEEKTDGPRKIYGFDMPLDRMYHRGHTWVRPDEDGTVLVGLDDLGTRLIGIPEAVELPKEGSKVTVNGTAWHMKKNGMDVRILAPVDGRVVEVGGPDKGWFLRVRPLEGKERTAHLLRGKEVALWLMRELERLQLSLAVEGVGASLADGGEPVKDFSQNYPAADWDSVLGEMFLEP